MFVEQSELIDILLSVRLLEVRLDIDEFGG